MRTVSVLMCSFLILHHRRIGLPNPVDPLGDGSIDKQLHMRGWIFGWPRRPKNSTDSLRMDKWKCERHSLSFILMVPHRTPRFYTISDRRNVFRDFRRPEGHTKVTRFQIKREQNIVGVVWIENADSVRRQEKQRCRHKESTIFIENYGCGTSANEDIYWLGYHKWRNCTATRKGDGFNHNVY